MDTIISAVIYVTAIGGICAIVLSVASRLMYIKVDDRIEKLQACLPGVNCGACGYPGCSGYAIAILSGEAKINLCTPGGITVLEQISTILGVKSDGFEKKIAVVSCNGDKSSQKKKMEYIGINSCEAAKPLFGGENSCVYGCLGYGDCQKICPAQAICMEKDLARIITNNCTGCGLCVKVCPKSLISIINASAPVLITCINTEKGAVTRKKCTGGCIGCGKCVRECPVTAIVMQDNLAKIDYKKCNGCGHCADICTTKCIHKLF